MMIASSIGASPDPVNSPLPFGNRIGSLITETDSLKNRVEDLHSRFSSGDSSVREQAAALARLSDRIKNFKEQTLQGLISNIPSRNETSVARAEADFANLYNAFALIEANSQPFWTTTKIVFVSALLAGGILVYWRRRNA